ncbi:MAG: tRNA dihydrouridine synthase DusB [Acidimicrobiales bacterium]|nr:tRNA dihydrouridine synthase DusB [Acidimicrobiales bacterium]
MAHPVPPALPLGPHRIWPPVVLAPMAGVTNRVFRTLCAGFGGGLYVAEMVSARALRFGDRKTWDSYVDFDPAERIRSLQLYATDPTDVAEAVRRLVGEGRLDHLDLNVGCPAPKITRKGGGSAIPLKANLLRSIVRAAVTNAGTVPVSVKCRIGLDERLVTYRTVGEVAAGEGCAWVALHGRTAVQLYGGQADWRPIAELKAASPIPVLGNGDLFTASDALRMVEETGCDGVVIGRGCLGRPWLFAELDAAFRGDPVPVAPRFGVVMAVLRGHLDALTEAKGEPAALREFRKHLSWYAKGYAIGVDVRRQLAQVSTRVGLEAVLALLDPDAAPAPGSERLPRAKSSSQRRVALPDGYLDELDDATPPPSADHPDLASVSGG